MKRAMRVTMACAVLIGVGCDDGDEAVDAAGGPVRLDAGADAQRGDAVVPGSDGGVEAPDGAPDPDLGGADDATAPPDGGAPPPDAALDAAEPDAAADGATPDAAAPDAGLPADPGESGALAVARSRATLEIPGGLFPTNIAMEIDRPQGAGPGPFPVVVFMHGFQLGPNDYTSYGTHLASWGYVTIRPQLPAYIGGPNHVQLAEQVGSILDWVEANADDPEGPLAGLADLERVVLAGHSLGGKLSFLVATQDVRPRAVVGVDPVDAAGGPIPLPPQQYPSVTPERMGDLAVPFLVIGETTNATCEGFGCQACAPEADNFAQYFEHAASPAMQIEVAGANHMSVLDNPDCGLACAVCARGDDDPAVTRLLTRRYLTAFLQVFVRGEDAWRPWIDGAGLASDVEAGLITAETANDL